MTDILSDTYWQSEFDITADDLDRITKWMRKDHKAFTLTFLTKRVVRGRLEHGEETSIPALPEWVQEQKVLSWDEEERWEIGSRVLVARTIEREIRPLIGIIVDENINTFFIRLEERKETFKYARAINEEEAKQRFVAIRKAVTAKERAIQQKQLRAEADENIEIVLLEHGARITTRLLTALENDSRFVTHGERWFLEELLIPLSQYQLKKFHHHMITKNISLTLEQLLLLVQPPLPTEDVGLFSLVRSLETDQHIMFEKIEVDSHTIWKPIKPPIPEWNEAEAAYYVYDPDTYEIIMQPGQPLKKQIAERLEELGMYEEVVSARAA